MKFFTADPHFGQFGISQMMGRVAPNGALMESGEQHDHILMSEINATVGRDDELIIIGDFCESSPGKYRSKIKCRHVRLIKGNHDPYTKCRNVFGEIPEIARTKVYNKSRSDYVRAFLCHYPTIYWDGSHKGWIHLYGHCHSQREEYLDQLEPGRRSMDVGVDNAYLKLGRYRPFSEVEIYDLMARRSGHDDVRFYKDLQTDKKIQMQVAARVMEQERRSARGDGQ